MSDEEPPVGVIVTAFLIFFGGFIPLIFGVGGFVLAAQNPSYPAGAPAAVENLFFQVRQFLTPVTFIGLGAWGLITGVGLLNLRAWARASILAFSGLVIPFYLTLTAVEVTASEGNAASGDFPVFLLSLVFLPVWLAVCWTVYFNLRRVRERFEASGHGAWFSIGSKSAAVLNLRAHPHVGVLLTSAVYLASSGFFFFALLRGVPASLFGRPLEGGAAGMLNAGACASALAVAAGLLRRRPWARGAAMVGCELQLLNWYAFMTMPRAQVHVAAVLVGLGVRIPVAYAAGLLPFIVDLATFLLSLLCLTIMGLLVFSRSAFADEFAK